MSVTIHLHLRINCDTIGNNDRTKVVAATVMCCNTITANVGKALNPTPTDTENPATTTCDSILVLMSNFKIGFLAELISVDNR